VPDGQHRLRTLLKAPPCCGAALQQGFLETAAYVNTTSNHKLSTNQTTVLIINIKNIKFVVSLVESRFCSHHITSHHQSFHSSRAPPKFNSKADCKTFGNHDEIPCVLDK